MLSLQESLRLLGRVAVSHEKKGNEDDNALELFMKSPGWNQLIAIASSLEPPSEHHSTSIRKSTLTHSLFTELKQALLDDGFEQIPEHMLQEIAGGSHHNQQHHAPPPAAAASGPPAERACPHCTFVNDASSQDCSICGLPLSG